MKDFDRISLIGFNDKAYCFCPLTVMNEAGKAKVISIIKDLDPVGGTNIEEGVNAALHILADRKVVNQISSILLLSDGCDNDIKTVNARVQEQFYSYKPKIKEKFRMYTFGYGRDHDSRVMNLMAEENNGKFYYIENEYEISDAFSLCLGELVALVASDIQVRLNILPCEVQFKLSKIYSTTSHTTFLMPDLLFNDKKDLVFILDFEACLPLPTGLIRPIEAVVTYTLKSGKIHQKQEFLMIELITSYEDIITNNEVLLEFYRVKSAEALEQATLLADNTKFKEAKVIVHEAEEEIKRSELIKNQKIQTLVMDLVDAQFRVESRYAWESGGRAQVT